MSFERAIELQKAWDWSGAKALWHHIGAGILQDLNLAICHAWLDDCDQVLAILDRYEPWPTVWPGLPTLSERQLAMLRRSLLAIELYAADCKGERKRAGQCVERLAALGGDVYELARTPVAIVWENGQLDVLEDVIHVGDLLIPITTYCHGLHHTPSEAARRLADLYPILRRDDLEPLTTSKERIAAALGLPNESETHVFTPREWQGTGDVPELDNIVDISPRHSSASPREHRALNESWPGYHDQLAAAFHAVAKEESRPREESPPEYARLYYMVKEFASYLPYWRALIRAGTSLYRARIVDHATCERDISYPPDPNFVREFGRVNAPEESIFYSANDARTAVAEVLNSWFETAQPGETRQVFVGRWLVTQDIDAALVPYHEEALSLSPARSFVRRKMELMRQEYAAPTYQLLRNCLAYLGAVYARKARNAFDYWVTTAYFNFVTNPRNFEYTAQPTPSGLLYPSVQMKYRGDNFATFPHMVQSAMHCIDACAMRFRCLDGRRFSFEGNAPRWFSKVGRHFDF